jgi:serine/threonine protein kinase
MAHGGVKPSNVFICQDDRVVLGDPSLAVQGIGLALDRLAYDYRYTAPESFCGGAITEPQSDFYSLGCVAYELACGEPPFVSDNYLELARRHVHEEILPPTQRGSKLGPAVDGVLLTLLARSRTDRFARADDVLRALEPPTFFRDDSLNKLNAPAPLPPLLRDASLVRLRATESVLGFDVSAASSMPDPRDTTGFGLSQPGGLVDRPAQEQPEGIGDYDIIETLGCGGMGIVYKARDRRLLRVVALKTLRSGLATDAEKRFVTEARAVAHLQHPNIVQIYEIGEHHGVPYISFEYVAGGSLAVKHHRDGPMSPRSAAEMVSTLARAVQHAHVRGVLHRDLKPSNILLTSEGMPKISDFGLAKIQELADHHASNQAERQDLAHLDPNITLAGAIIGTAAYMPPEQAAGNIKGLGPAADIYSLGAILYELLTGKPPFQGSSVREILLQHRTAQAVPPHKLLPAVGRELSAICLKCLEKEPGRRYSSAQALADDLERWLTGRPTVAHPVSGVNRIMRWCWRSLNGLVRRKRS